MSSSADKARDLADLFKMEGHFDKLKESILSRSADDAGNSVAQLIRNEVSTVVRGMVLEDENLIFKNRGSTSALIESRLLKGSYEKLGHIYQGRNVEEYVQAALHDPNLLQQIERNLQNMLQNTKNKP